MSTRRDLVCLLIDTSVSITPDVGEDIFGTFRTTIDIDNNCLKISYVFTQLKSVTLLNMSQVMLPEYLYNRYM